MGTLNDEEPIDAAFLSILRCPLTKQSLTCTGDGFLVTEDESRRYPIREGIIDFINSEDTDTETAAKGVVKDYYEGKGWSADEGGVYHDTKRFMALQEVARDYTRRCNLRIAKALPASGKYLVDAGSGAIPHDEYLKFHDNFEFRICVDFSFAALQEARRKIGAKGRYVMADLRSLPFDDRSVDAVVCCHVIYHVAAEEQGVAIIEQSRILKPGGKAAIVYQWGHADLLWRLSRVFNAMEQLFSKDTGPNKTPPQRASQDENLYFHAHETTWLTDQDWPFQYEIRTFRILDNPMMKRYLKDAFLWRAMVRMLLIWQWAMPKYIGRHGAYPLIIVYPLKRS